MCVFYFRYMKGRILYEQVNNLIDELNQVYFTKHNLLKMPASKRTVMQKREYQTFKQHDIKETKGNFTSLFLPQL